MTHPYDTPNPGAQNRRPNPGAQNPVRGGVVTWVCTDVDVGVTTGPSARREL